tara:strand:- start:390 stop:749 length:360 start_codon:yes stop_codon:yes gene_type:complete
MANEIKITTGMSCLNGNLNITVPSRTISVDQTTARGGNPASVEVGTSEETISFGDTTARYVHMQNLDSTNFIELGFSTGVYGIKLLAGETAVFPLKTSASLKAKADTAACTLQVIGLSE